MPAPVLMGVLMGVLVGVPWGLMQGSGNHGRNARAAGSIAAAEPGGTGVAPVPSTSPQRKRWDGPLPPGETGVPYSAVQAIKETLAAMERAALRADSGAYMALVDTADPVFAEEQRKWARDLRTHPVERVSISIADDGEVALHSDGAVAPVVLSWRLPGEDRERSVLFEAAFRPLGLPGGVWLFSGRVWEPVATDGARVLIDPDDAEGGEMGEHLAGRAAELLASVQADLGERLASEPTIKIYPDMQSLQASISLSYTDSLGGWNEPGESIKLLSRAGFAGPALEATVAHELGHAVSFEYGQAVITAPWWSLEGIAEVAADPFREGVRTDAARGLARDGLLVDFSRLADFRGGAMQYGRQVYVQGHSMVSYIGERFGDGARNDWFRAMGAGRSLEEATRAVLGVGFDQLDRDWRASLTAGEPPAQ